MHGPVCFPTVGQSTLGGSCWPQVVHSNRSLSVCMVRMVCIKRLEVRNHLPVQHSMYYNSSFHFKCNPCSHSSPNTLPTPMQHLLRQAEHPSRPSTSSTLHIQLLGDHRRLRLAWIWSYHGRLQHTKGYDRAPRLRSCDPCCQLSLQRPTTQTLEPARDLDIYCGSGFHACAMERLHDRGEQLGEV